MTWSVVGRWWFPSVPSCPVGVAETEDFVNQIGGELGGLILGLVGFNDAERRVTAGHIVACVAVTPRHPCRAGRPLGHDVQGRQGRQGRQRSRRDDR
jgi:hypothetical protein